MKPEEYVYAQWQYIYDQFSAEMNFGAGGPGTGTNPTGALGSVASIGKSTWPDFTALPYVGVQLDKIVEERVASQRRHRFTSTFSIVALVNVEAVGDSVLKVEDAMSKLRSVIWDPTTGGLSDLLRRNSNFTLGMNADESWLSDTTYLWDQVAIGSGTQYVAYAMMTLVSTKLVTVGR